MNKKPLKNICTKIGSGSTPKGGKAAYKLEGIAIIRSQNILDFSLTSKGLAFIDETQAAKLKNVIIEKNDVLINITGDSVARVCSVPDWVLPARVNQHVAILRANPKILISNFLKYHLLNNRSKKELLNLSSSGATRNALTKTMLEEFEINLPPLPEQKAIAHILGTLDDKIELNRKMNETLEAMAQATFKSWFVDFDPVIDNALAQGNEIPEGLKAKAARRKAVLASGQYKALPAAIQALFPASFVYNEELGKWIPEGWEVLNLDVLAKYQNGLALQKFRPDNETDDFLPVLKISHLKKGNTDEKERAKTSIKTECIVNNGDVIFSWSASLMVKIWTGGKAALNQHLFKVTSDKYPKWMYYYFTKYHLDEFIRIANDKAVTMGHIKREHLSNAKCVIMKGEIPRLIHDNISVLIDRVINSNLIISELENTRKVLLSQLISGKTRLPASFIQQFESKTEPVSK